MKRTSYIAVLEDDPERIAVMKELAEAQFSKYACIVIDNAPDMIEWLKTNSNHLALLSLDHDLDLCPGALEGKVDPGDGRVVAAFLQRVRPVCPVILHTSNADARTSMRFMLKEAGWKVVAAFPSSGTQWLKEEWMAEVRKCLPA